MLVHHVYHVIEKIQFSTEKMNGIRTMKQAKLGYFFSVFRCFGNYIMRILTGFVVVQENIKPEVLKVQTELARSVQ